MDICGMCNKESVLQNSHAIPDSVFKKILRSNSGKAIVVPAGGSDPIHYSSDSWDTSFLCGECESLLNSLYESYSLRVLRGSVGDFQRHDLGVTFSGFDPYRLTSFFISVFWRAANSKHSSYGKVYIPEPWNGEIRDHLFKNTPIPFNLASVKISRLIDRTPKNGFTLSSLKSVVMSPFFRKHKYGKYSFCFVFEGFFVEIFTPGLTYSLRRQAGVILKDKRVLMVPYLDIFDVPEIVDALVKGYGKYLDGDVTFKD